MEPIGSPVTILDPFSNDAFRNFLCLIGIKIMRFCLEQEQITSSMTFFERSGIQKRPITMEERGRMQFFNGSIFRSTSLPRSTEIFRFWSIAHENNQNSVLSIEAIEDQFVELIRKRTQLVRFPIKALRFIYFLIFPSEANYKDGDNVPKNRDFLLFKLRSLYDEVVHYQSLLLDAILTPVAVGVFPIDQFTSDHTPPTGGLSYENLPIPVEELPPIEENATADQSAIPKDAFEIELEELIKNNDTIARSYEYKVLVAWQKARKA
ncbi:galactosyltransferase [Perkinsela sp. CCAP 1560/4]|nr:galactosyltransferase [Perkinsela sp. CCAP 1560/4]|eukprot:KNH07159.1 galactosyltransferase [Perkinsela sp. CCAP 1560/4]